MASCLSSLEEDLKCALCHKIYKNPLILLCTHSFCKSCLESSWSERGAKECPVCKKRSSIEHPPINRALKSACETFIQERSLRVSDEAQGLLCPQHLVKTQLFCLHDEQLICAECVTQEHNNHNFCSISKAASERREELRGPLQELQANQAALSSEKLTCLSISQEIQSQLLQTQMQITKEFEKLHQFLRDEEEARISALKKEAEKKSQKIEEKIEEIDNLLSSISKKIKYVEDHMNAEDSLFLKDFKEVEESAEYTVPDEKLDPGSLIDVAKHLGNMRYRVWEKMKDVCPYYPVILEPNTGNSSLQLSADLVKVASRDLKHNLPNNPERFTIHPAILGSEGFNSGTHSWVVDVGESQNWTIGVIAESVKRKEEISISPENRVWAIQQKDGLYTFNTGYHQTRKNCEVVKCMKMMKERDIDGSYSFNPGHGEVERVKRIRIQLDFNRRQLTFFNLQTNTQLQSYNYTPEKMYPYFSTTSDIPLRILPFKVSLSPS